VRKGEKLEWTVSTLVFTVGYDHDVLYFVFSNTLPYLRFRYSFCY